MRTLGWIWPIVLVAVVFITPWAVWTLQPDRPLAMVVVDKTVPFQNHLEHRSLFWLLDHLRYSQQDGTSFDATSDYLGSIPGPESGDPPAETHQLTVEGTAGATLLYLADTYGVYEGDLESKEMKSALERSPKVYGGLSDEEAEVASSVVQSGNTLIAEFNTFASPTGRTARRTMEHTLGVHWTRWVGRYFADLQSVDEVPQWMRDNYLEIHEQAWKFDGPGWVILRDDEAIEILRVRNEVNRKGLQLRRELPNDPWMDGVRDGVAYPYWFDIVEADPGTEILMSYRWDLLPAGESILSAHGLPKIFPAVTRKSVAVDSSTGTAVYFAGDFADNPMPDIPVPLAGWSTFRRLTEGYKWAPSESAFFWRVYVPMMRNIFERISEEYDRS